MLYVPGGMRNRDDASTQRLSLWVPQHPGSWQFYRHQLKDYHIRTIVKPDTRIQHNLPNSSNSTQTSKYSLQNNSNQRCRCTTQNNPRISGNLGQSTRTSRRLLRRRPRLRCRVARSLSGPSHPSARASGTSTSGRSIRTRRRRRCRRTTSDSHRELRDLQIGRAHV